MDLTGARHVEAIGVKLLRWATDHDDGAAGLRPVEFLLPDPLPDPTGNQGQSAPATSLAASGELQQREAADARGGDSSPRHGPKVVPVHAAL